MKLFVFLSMVVCLTLKVCSADLTSFSAVNETSWKSGTECLGAYCTTKKGHFSESSLVTNGNVRTYDKQLNPGIYTNFVVYIKNVQSTYESVMTLCTAWNQCVVVSNKGDQVLVFRRAPFVHFRFHDPAAKFEVQFYAGCDVVDSTNIVISRQQGEAWNYYTNPGHCWVIMPRVFTASLTQHTTATYAYFNNVSIPEGSHYTMYNMMTGEEAAKISPGMTSEVANIQPSETPTSYVVDYKTAGKLSTAIVLELDVCTQESCIDIQFNLRLKALSLRDSQCIYDKQSCEYGLYDEEQCAAQKSVKCSAYDEFNQAFEEGEEEQNDLSMRAAGRSTKWCSKKFNGNEKRLFCSKKKHVPLQKHCKKFRKCNTYCISYSFMRCNQRKTSTSLGLFS